jgi:hypothetical protein
MLSVLVTDLTEEKQRLRFSKEQATTKFEIH